MMSEEKEWGPKAPNPKWYVAIDKWIKKKWYYEKEYNFELPDPKRYAKIDGIEELEYVRDTLAKRGLKDPWIRNEVWRYKHPQYQKQMEKFMATMLFEFGFKWGLLAAIATITAQHTYWKIKYGQQPPYVSTLWDWLNYTPAEDKKHHH